MDGSSRTAGCSKGPFIKAAASEEARRTLRYVEPLSDARTQLAGFFNILLEEFGVCGVGGGSFPGISSASW